MAQDSRAQAFGLADLVISTGRAGEGRRATMKISLRNKNLLVYSAKCSSGILLCSLLSRFLGHWIDYPWSLVSLVMVLSPGGHDALDLARTRIKANLVGAAVGIVVLALLIPAPWSLAMAAPLALYVCDRLGLNAGARATLAAVIIILLHPEGTHPWDAALNRALAAVVGGLLGWGLTYVFHAAVHFEPLAVNPGTVRRNEEG